MEYEHEIIKGLYLIPRYIDSEECDKIVKYIQENCPWVPVTSSKNSREVVQFGYTYSYDRSGVTKTTDIPGILKQVTEPMNQYLKLDTNVCFDQLIINKYEQGQAISPHIDSVKYFGDLILCITLISPVTAIFKRGDQEARVELEPGSAYIMSGDARYKWTHQMRQANGTRISLTYRTVI
jgi:alkylated DNA repair dioxygenase AlkB